MESTNVVINDNYFDPLSSDDKGCDITDTYVSKGVSGKVTKSLRKKTLMKMRKVS